MVEGRNVNGYSVPSNDFSILHAIAPEVPGTPTTTNSGTNIVIDWSAPTDNGSVITSYTILILQSDGLTYTEDSVNCDGLDSTIILATQCTIPLSVLTSAPYSLSLTTSVQAKVAATNVKNTSLLSSAGNGATIITTPDAPISLSENTAQRTASTLGLTWTEGNANGGSAIIDYRINYAEQGETYSVLTSTSSSSYQITGLTAGKTYEFKIEARNEYGYSIFSSTLSLLCATIPAVPTSIATTYSHGSTVKVTWSLPTTNGSPITAYKIFIK